MDPNTLLFGVLGVALGILAGWIFTVRYRAKARAEASSIIELARKEASVDRKQQLAEADLEIKKQQQSYSAGNHEKYGLMAMDLNKGN